MPKSFSGILAAVALLLTGLFCWNAEATPLVGKIDFQSGTMSLLEKTGCNDQADNPADATACEADYMVSCKQRAAAPVLMCECQSCTALTPEKTDDPIGPCPCPTKRCCNYGIGKWCCSP